MDKIDTLIEQLPHGTRVGPYLRRMKRRQMQRDVINDLRIEAMGRELATMIETEIAGLQRTFQVLPGGKTP